MIVTSGLKRVNHAPRIDIIRLEDETSGEDIYGEYGRENKHEEVRPGPFEAPQDTTARSSRFGLLLRFGCMVLR